MRPRDQFGDNVEAMRTQRQLTQEDLSGLAGVHPSEVSRVERGVRDPRLETVVRIARGLGVPLERLVSGIA